MKRVIAVLLLILALGAVAFGQSVNPWFEVENVGIDAKPTLEAGVAVEGNLSPSWAMDFGFTYEDRNLLNPDNAFGLGFEANVAYEDSLEFLGGGDLDVGCSLSFTQDATYKTKQYPERLKLKSRTTGILAEGLVGPFTIWAGVDFPWDGTQWLDFIPVFGFRVDFDINLAKPAEL
jgi:hypothetical protein